MDRWYTASPTSVVRPATEASGRGNLVEELLGRGCTRVLHFAVELFEREAWEHFLLSRFLLRHTSVYDYPAYFPARLNFGFAKFGGVLHFSAVSA